MVLLRAAVCYTRSGQLWVFQALMSHIFETEVHSVSITCNLGILAEAFREKGLMNDRTLMVLVVHVSSSTVEEGKWTATS